MRTSDDLSDATLAEITAELDVEQGGDGVWIDPAIVEQHGITPSQEASIEEAVASADADVFVVLAAVDFDDPRFSDASSVVAWVEDDLGTGGTYVVTRSPGRVHDVELATYAPLMDDAYVGLVANAQHRDDPVAQTLTAIELLDSGGARKTYEALPDSAKYPYGEDEPVDDGVSGWLIGGLVVLVVGGVALGARHLLGRRRRTAGVPVANEPRFRLPERVLRTVREAENRQVRQRADRAVLALGEALDAAEITDRSDAALEAWQSALDHYAASRRVLEEAGSPADVVGALVLAQRGSSALRASQRPGTRWTPTPTCYFNPLHEGPRRSARWAGQGQAVTVPACAACAASLAAGDEPADVLDFIDGKETVHYYALDIPPWSTTGYGSLEPDLLAALLRTAR